MDPVVALLLKNGVFGILAGVILYLYIRERKINHENNRSVLKQSVEDAAAKTRLALALEDLVVTVSTQESNMKAELLEFRRALEEIKVKERIKEAVEDERRRTISNPFIKTGEGDDGPTG